VEKQPRFHIFAGEGVNEPSVEKAQWVIGSLLASSLIADPSAIPAERVAGCFRSDIFHQATQLSPANTP
jgi:hypothetical protein